MSKTSLTVKAKVKAVDSRGLFRAGRFWPGVWTEVELERAVFEQLQLEPRLQVADGNGVVSAAPEPAALKALHQRIAELEAQLAASQTELEAERAGHGTGKAVLAGAAKNMEEVKRQLAVSEQTRAELKKELDKTTAKLKEAVGALDQARVRHTFQQ